MQCFTPKETELWRSIDIETLEGPSNNLSSMLGEIKDDEFQSMEEALDSLDRLGDYYEHQKQYLKAAACFHRAIPLHDKYDTYAWQRCYNLRQKLENNGTCFDDKIWGVMLDETWKSLLSTARAIKDRDHNRDSTEQPEPNLHPAAPVYIAA